MPLIALGVIGAVGSVAGAAIASSGAQSAAGTQANAANYAANLNYQAQQASLAQQEKQWEQEQQNIQPWLTAGRTGLGALSYGLGLDTGQGNMGAPGMTYGSLVAPWTGQFKPPTAEEAAATPGYQFQLQQGLQALERSAAARGGLLSGGTGKALERYGQGLASSNYQQTYNNMLGQYQQNYNIFKQNQADQYNRLAGMSGTGQVAAGQLGTAGQNASNAITNILMGGAQTQGTLAQNAAAARATGYQNTGNIWGNAFNGISGNLMQAYLMNKMYGGGGTGYDNPDATIGFDPNYIPGLT